MKPKQQVETQQLPYLLAAMLCQNVDEISLRMAGPGFRDCTSMISHLTPKEATLFLFLHPKELISAIDRLIEELEGCAAVLKHDGQLYRDYDGKPPVPNALRGTLERGKTNRDKIL